MPCQPRSFDLVIWINSHNAIIFGYAFAVDASISGHAISNLQTFLTAYTTGAEGDTERAPFFSFIKETMQLHEMCRDFFTRNSVRTLLPACNINWPEMYLKGSTNDLCKCKPLPRRGATTRRKSVYAPLVSLNFFINGLSLFREN